MMEWNLNTDHCTGCCACADVCPAGAISMEIGPSGSRRPKLNDELCISCSKCKKVCPQFVSPAVEGVEKNIYIGICQEDALYQKSSSGGIFAALATSFLNRGGVVYGAAMGLDGGIVSCRHIRVSKKEDLHLIQGSKYVQSKMDGIYRQIKEDLKEGKEVLFSGTSCQVAGVKNFIGNHDNLYTVDLVCHGVPKDSIFNEYIKFLEGRYNGKVEDLSFRVKGFRNFWTDSSYVLKLTCKTEKGSRIVYIPKDNSAYFKLFLTRAGYRESCYSCKYASLNKVSDVTLGDFRPSPEEKKQYELDSDKTYSSIIVHNPKGAALLERGKTLIRFKGIPAEEMIKHHSNLQRPSSMTKAGKDALSIYQKQGFEGLQKRIDRTFLINQLKSSLIQLVKRFR